MLAAEAVSCLNKALCHLKDIWEEIGIPEDQRLQRTNVVKSHIKVGTLCLVCEGRYRSGGQQVSTEEGVGWCWGILQRNYTVVKLVSGWSYETFYQRLLMDPKNNNNKKQLPFGMTQKLNSNNFHY